MFVKLSSAETVNALIFLFNKNSAAKVFKVYKNYFNWSWYGGTKNDGKRYWRQILYHPSAGFYVKHPDWGIGHAYTFDPTAKTNQNTRIVHDQILPHLGKFPVSL